MAAVFAACAPSEPSRPPPPALPSPSATTTTAQAESQATQAAAPPTETHVALLRPADLDVLEARGFTLAELVTEQRATTTQELARLTSFRSIFEVVRADVRSTARAQPPARVTSVDGFRLFDETWLDSSEMSFQLSGVFNRLDRRAFYDGTCGEVRFVYRLRYRTQQGTAQMESRLPMSVNVVFLVDSAQGCASPGRGWQAPATLEGAPLVEWLTTEGALGAAARQRWTLKSVETNLQTIRLQSTVQTTLAGHIEYGMHVFHPVDPARTSFVAAPMENMPDVARLAGDAAGRAELLAFLRDPAALAAVDRGTLRVPDRFLATSATSVSPRALTRPANRPFSRLYDDDDFEGLDLGAYRTIRTPKALLRRLDGASCTGCHQSRTIAGFHHVGDDADGAPAWSSLWRGSSNHLLDDLERRRVYVTAVAEGRAPDEFRPIPERQGVGTGLGAPCGLGDPGLSDWTCAEGLRCQKLEDPDVGVCLAEPALGSPCEYGIPVPHADPHRDAVRDTVRHPCGPAQTCNRNLSGFPLGFCSSACATAGPAGTCSDFLDVDGFQACLRAGRTYDDCAGAHVLDVGVPACDLDRPCRQDYVCARTDDAAVGACVPPYFVFALRLDGYPLKR